MTLTHYWNDGPRAPGDSNISICPHRKPASPEWVDKLVVQRQGRHHSGHSRNRVPAETLHVLGQLNDGAEGDLGGVTVLLTADIAHDLRPRVGVVKGGERISNGHTLRGLAVHLTSGTVHGDGSKLILHHLLDRSTSKACLLRNACRHIHGGRPEGHANSSEEAVRTDYLELDAEGMDDVGAVESRRGAEVTCSPDRRPRAEGSERIIGAVELEGTDCIRSCGSGLELEDCAFFEAAEYAVWADSRISNNCLSSSESSPSDTTHGTVTELASLVPPAPPFPFEGALSFVSFGHGYLDSLIYTHRNKDRCARNGVHEVSRDR